MAIVASVMKASVAFIAAAGAPLYESQADNFAAVRAILFHAAWTFLKENDSILMSSSKKIL